MDNLREQLINEFESVSLDISASQIVSAYQKRQRKFYAIIISSVFCVIIASAVLNMNTGVITNFVTSTGEFLKNCFSDNQIEQYSKHPTEQPTNPKPSEDDAVIPQASSESLTKQEEAQKTSVEALSPQTTSDSSQTYEATDHTEESGLTEVTDPTTSMESFESEKTSDKPQSDTEEKTEPTEEKNEETEATTESNTIAPTSKNKAVSKKISSANIKYIKISKDTIRITKCIPTENKVIIPQTIDGYTVTAIGEGILKGYCDVEEVVLPDTVTKIGDNAFKELDDLEKINIPKNIKYIGDSAFEDCTSITSVNLREVETIGNSAFRGCDGIKAISVPKTAKFVGTKAFAESDGIESAVISSNCDDNNEHNYNYTFADCDNLKSVVISEGVTAVQSYQFYYCQELKKVTFPSTLQSLGTSAFSCCVSLENPSLKNGLKTIGQRAFYKCRALSDIALPESLTAVYKEAFYGCKKLSLVTIPKNVTTLGNMSFGYYDGDKKLNGFTISGYEKTAAKTYALNNGFKFLSRGDAGSQTPGNKVNTTITLDSYIAVLNIGDTYIIKYSVDSPEGDTTFSSSDESVAKVDNTGKVTALKSGKANISVTNNGVTKQFVVVVK